MKIRVITTLFAVMLTARMGILNNSETGLKESWYNLRMNRIVAKADAHFGLQDVYEVREDGVKTYNGLVICAGDSTVPYGTVVETSLGTGIVLDRHTVNDETLIDIAVAW